MSKGGTVRAICPGGVKITAGRNSSSLCEIYQSRSLGNGPWGDAHKGLPGDLATGFGLEQTSRRRASWLAKSFHQYTLRLGLERGLLKGIGRCQHGSLERVRLRRWGLELLHYLQARPDRYSLWRLEGQSFERAWSSFSSTGCHF